ncbi:hypothetical protein AB0F85_13520 [Nocardia fluminea]
MFPQIGPAFAFILFSSTLLITITGAVLGDADYACERLFEVRALTLRVHMIRTGRNSYADRVVTGSLMGTVGVGPQTINSTS